MIKNYFFIIILFSFVGLQGFSDNSFGARSENATNVDIIFPPCDKVIGESCDDGNPNTVNDRVGADCNCAGEPIATSCDDVSVTYQVNGGLIETGAIINLSETDSLELFANLSEYELRDPSGNLVPNNRIENITSAQAGDYTVNSVFTIPTPVAAAPVVHSVSSVGRAHEVAANVLDGDPLTYWHTTWITAGQPANDPPYPHTIVFDMGENAVISGFNYLARQGATEEATHGRIKGYEIFVSNSPTEKGMVVHSGEFEDITRLQRQVFPATQGRYVHFVATTPQNSAHPWASAAEIGFYRVTATASSEETVAEANHALNAVDSRNDTFWHTLWQNPSVPQDIILDLGTSSNITGLTYKPRQTGVNGIITEYEIYISDTPDFTGIDGHHNGTWANNNSDKVITFPEITGRYVRLVARAGYGNWASAAEITVTRPTVNMTCAKTITINVTPRNIYAFNNGTWSPELPVAGPTANDILIVNEGDAVFDTSFTVDKVIVNPGASLTINSGITLVSNSMELKSQSNSFSSLIVDGDIIGVVTYERWVNQIGTSAGGGNDLVSSPVSGAQFNNAFRVANLDIIPENPDPAKKGEFAFAPYNVEVGAYQNISIGADYTGVVSIVPGVGYRAATHAISPQTGNTLIFSGSAEKENVNVAITDATAGKAWNLIGNPYPSYLNFHDFLSANINQLDSRNAYQAIYGYTGRSDSDVGPKWTPWNLATIDDNRLIAPGQGFFVKSQVNGGNIQFTPSMRSAGNSDDFIPNRPTNSKKALSKLVLNSAGKNSETSIYFIEGTTKGMDPGYDASVFTAFKNDFLLFTNLLEDNPSLNIAIQSLPYNDFNNVIVPLGMKVKAGVALTISIDDLSTLPSNINVYLEDTQTKTLTLLNDAAYTFTPTTDINGSGRFNVHYSAKTLSVDDLDSSDNIRIYTTMSPKKLYVKGQLSKATTAHLYDIQGRMVMRKVLNSNSNENSLDISTLGTGIYVVKVTNDNQVKTQKVIIK